MADQENDDEQPIAWMAVPQDTPVRTSDAEMVGTLSDVLGSRQEDIFHGVVVHLGRFGHHVFVSADDVSLLALSVVGVALTSAEIHALPVHDEERQYDLGIVGLFRKHPGWVREKDR